MLRRICDFCDRPADMLYPYEGKGRCICCWVNDDPPVAWLVNRVIDGFEQVRQQEIYSEPVSYQNLSLSRSNKVLTQHPKDLEEAVCIGLGILGRRNNAQGEREYCYQISRWTRSGLVNQGRVEGWASASQLLKNLEAEILSLWLLSDADLFSCAGCQTKLKQNEVSGSHFAARYCAVCWTAYQKENLRTCYLCRKPMYECYC